MPGRFETDPVEPHTGDRLTFDDVTMIVLIGIVTLCLCVVFGLGLWSAGKHLFCACHLH